MIPGGVLLRQVSLYFRDCPASPLTRPFRVPYTIPYGGMGDKERDAMAEHVSDKKVLNRLARIEGHVRAVRGMIEDGRDCADVLIQLAAVRSAVDRVSRVVLKDHIRECVAGRPRGPELTRTLGDLDKALDSFAG